MKTIDPSHRIEPGMPVYPGTEGPVFILKQRPAAKVPHRRLISPFPGRLRHLHVKRNALILLFIAVVLAAAGCMRVGPDYARPEAGFAMPAQFANTALAGEYPADDKWWEAFNDPVLNDLVLQVVSGNHDIHQAASGVMEARARLVQVDADRYPRAGVSAQASRSRQSVENPITGRTEAIEASRHSLSVPASFEIDLWGRLARASEAGRAELMAAEYNRRTVVHSLIAEAVTRYLEIRALEARIHITEKMAETTALHLALVENRHARGLAPVIEVHQARRSLAQVRSRLPALRQAAGLSKQALSIMQGQYPESADTIVDTTGQTAYTFRMPDPVPEGLPSELLHRRPDVRAAEARLEAASARIGQAKAARFPSLSLTGVLGYSSDALQSFFASQNEIYNMAAEAAVPVFDAGRRKAGQKAAEARFEAESAAYARAVLAAFGEVEGALLTRRELVQRREDLAAVLEDAKITETIAQDRYQRGLTDYSAVIDAMQARFQAEMELVESESALYANRVRLHRVLGGGWDHVLTDL